MKYILFDTALNGLYSLHLLQQAYPDNLSLFTDTRDENMIDVAPFMFKADELFFRKTDDPFISLEAMVAFESEESIDDLLTHFRPFIYRTVNGKEHYFRFWDARVLSRFLSSDYDATHDAFFDGIDKYYTIDHEHAAAKCFYIDGEKIMSEEIPLNKLFTVDEGLEMAAELGEDTKVKSREKENKRRFFK